MSRLKSRNHFREDQDYSDDQSPNISPKKAPPQTKSSQFANLKRQIKILQSEVKTLKRLSILSVFGNKENMLKFYQDIW